MQLIESLFFPGGHCCYATINGRDGVLDLARFKKIISNIPKTLEGRIFSYLNKAGMLLAGTVPNILLLLILLLLTV